MVCVNVVSLPVGKQNNIEYEMYERADKQKNNCCSSIYEHE